MVKNTDICYEGNLILRNKSKEVKLPLSAEDEKLAIDLLQYVIISENDALVKQFNIKPGVGIAAPQVGQNKRMFAVNFVDFLDEKQKKYTYVFINPKIIKKSSEMTYLPLGEGCLSVTRNTNNLVTPRHYSITYKATIYDIVSKKLTTKTETLYGYPAIVFQHEYDHLDGILFVDKLYEADKIDIEPLFEYEK